MKDINLISFKIDDKTKKTKKIITIILFLVTVMILLSFGALNMIIKKNKDETVENKREMSRYSEVTTVKTDINMYNEKLKQMKYVLDSVSGKSVLNINLLKAIAKAMPNDICIINYSISKAGDITLVGNSASNDSVAHFRYKLDESKEFDTIAVKSIKLENSREGQGTSGTAKYTFDMSLKLKR